MFSLAHGAPFASYEYDPFGNLTAESGTFLNPYRYAGEYYDNLHELYYLRSRFYNPVTARFINRAKPTWVISMIP